jgi:hypothetical protein
VTARTALDRTGHDGGFISLARRLVFLDRVADVVVRDERLRHDNQITVVNLRSRAEIIALPQAVGSNAMHVLRPQLAPPLGVANVLANHVAGGATTTEDEHLLDPRRDERLDGLPHARARNHEQNISSAHAHLTLSPLVCCPAELL